MKIVHTSDWHIGRYLSGYSLIEGQRYFLQQLEELLVQEEVDLLLVAGDVFHSSIPSAEGITLLETFLSRLVLERGIEVVLIAGNHDSPQRLEAFHRLLEREGLWIQGSLSLEMKVVSRQKEGKTTGIFLLPFFQSASVRELFGDVSPKTCDEALQCLLERYQPDPAQYDYSILMAHGFYLPISGETLIHCDSELTVGGVDGMSLRRFPHFDYIALGHLHLPQRAGDFGFYSGSPLAYSVSESVCPKGVRLLETKPDGGIDSTFVPISPLYPVRELTGSLLELLEQPSEDFVAIHLTDNEYQPEDFRRLRAAFPHILNLQYQNITFDSVSDATDSALKKPEEIWREFYRKTTGQEATSSENLFFYRALQEVLE